MFFLIFLSRVSFGATLAVTWDTCFSHLRLCWVVSPSALKCGLESIFSLSAMSKMSWYILFQKPLFRFWTCLQPFQASSKIQSVACWLLLLSLLVLHQFLPLSPHTCRPHRNLTCFISWCLALMQQFVKVAIRKERLF